MLLVEEIIDRMSGTCELTECWRYKIRHTMHDTVGYVNMMIQFIFLFVSLELNGFWFCRKRNSLRRIQMDTSWTNRTYLLLTCLMILRNF